MAVVLDLDGVVWLEGEALPGAPEAVARLQSRHDVWFVTNASAWGPDAQAARLAACGIEAEGRVLTSAMAAGSLLRPGDAVLVVGGEGVRGAVRAAGATLVERTADVDAVVVGLDPGFDYAMLERASAAVRGGARLIGTNDDVTYPAAGRLRPGGGALLAAVAAAGGAAPQVAGKPHPPMVELVRAAVGSGEGVVVGDRRDTDGALADALGWSFLLVGTGVGDEPLDEAAGVVADLAAAGALL